MNLHLFSSPGERDIRYILEASRPYLTQQPNPTVAYFPAAAARYNWLDYTQNAFQGLGDIALIDVEQMRLSEIEPILDRAALIYISGGNTFLLNHRLHHSGLFPLLRQKIGAGLPVVGFSAGATLCGPNILSCNDMNMCATTYFSALDLVPYNFSVHYPADDPTRAERDEWLQQYHVFYDNPILALEDGAYVQVQKGQTRLMLGNAWLLAKDAAREPVAHGVPLPEVF